VFAVIFISTLNPEAKGYEQMANQMETEVGKMDGFISMASARSEKGITVCFWEHLEGINAWKDHSKHQAAQEKGRASWYLHYEIYICNVLESRQYERN
jgi:heme-degrading monooxygenase HmoA